MNGLGGRGVRVPRLQAQLSQLNGVFGGLSAPRKFKNAAHPVTVRLVRTCSRLLCRPANTRFRYGNQTTLSGKSASYSLDG